MKISGLLESLGLTEEDTERLRQMRIEAAGRELAYLNAMKALGKPPYHGVNKRETAKRRVRNKMRRETRQRGR